MKKKIYLVAIVVTLALIMSFALVGCKGNDTDDNKTPQTPTVEELYYNSVIDAMTIEANELQEYLTLTPNTKGVTFNETNDKVLMYTFHKYPDSYADGAEVLLKYGHVWTVTDGELKDWYKANKEGVTNWKLRFTQLIGGHFNSGYTHLTAMWVNVSDCWRPAYNSDVTDSKVLDYVKGDDEFNEWFKDNVYNSYYGAQYPWTRLGYTYDWAHNTREFGLHEFLARKGSTVKIEFTKTIDDFVTYLNTLS